MTTSASLPLVLPTGTGAADTPEELDRLRRKIRDYDRWFLFLDGQMRVLERERQKLAAVVNHTDAGVLVFDAALRAVWANEQVPVPKSNGEAAGSLEGQPCWRIVCDQKALCASCPAAHVLGSGTVGHREIRQERDGRPRHIYATALPIKSIEGNVEETIVMLQDVSDLDVLRLSQEALRASEEHYRILVESIDVLPWEYDLATRQFTYVGPQALRLMGYPVEEWYAPEFFESHIHAEDRERTLVQCAAATAQGQSHELEYRMISAEGRIVWMRDLVSVIMEEDKPVRLRGFMVDITARKQEHEALIGSEARQGAILEASLDAIVSFDDHGLITVFNAAAEALFGLERAAAVGRPFVATVLAAEERGRFQRLRADLLGHPGGPAGRRLEMTARRADGSELPVELSLTRVLIEGPAVFTAYIRDLSERRRAESELKSRDEQLRQSQKMEALGSLAGGVAHDFNNILTGIIGHSEILLAAQSADDKARKSAQTICTAAHRAADLTRKLLDFSRREPKATAVDMHRIVEEVIGLLERTFEKNIEIARDFAPDAPRAMADAGQLQQVMLNLAVNARDAMSDGGRILFTTRRLAGAAGEPDRLLLAVSDTGCGMAPEVQEKIFEPLFTTKERGKGTGMGLATVYSIIASHGGRITVESAPGAGTTFRVELPATEAPAGEARAAHIKGGAKRAGRILVVDDDDVVRELTGRLLKQLGHDVRMARDGIEAMELYKTATLPVDLVILDLAMPRMGGKETWRALRAYDPEARVLLTSGYGCNSEAESLLAEGMLGFIQKPFDLAGLSETVAEAIGPRRVETTKS